jgi:hypothetical protein
MSKAVNVAVLALSLWGGSDSSATEVWLVASGANSHRLIRVDENGAHSLELLGGATSYGFSEQTIALISYRRESAQHYVDLVDRASGEIEASWPILGRSPVQYLNGLVNEVVIANDSVYFPSLHWLTERALELNADGDAMHLSALSLKDGTARSFPLEHSSNPHVAAYGDGLLLYEGPGDRLRTFDVDTHSFVVLQSARVTDTAREERDALRQRRIDYSSATRYVVMPGHGVFRLSRFGRLEQVLDKNLQDPMDARFVDFGSLGSFRGIVSTRDSDSPAACIAYEQPDVFKIRCADLRSLQVTQTFSLPKTVDIEGLSLADDGDVSYWDRSSGALTKRSNSGEKVLTHISPEANSMVRILIAH